MLRIRRFEEKLRRAVQRREDPRLPAPLHRRGGGRRRASCRRSTPDDAIVATYREHGHALARGVAHGRRSWPRCTARATAAAAAAAARCTCSTRRPASTAATRSSAAGCRSRSGSRWPTRCAAGRRRHRLLLRRRRGRRGRVPRVPQPGRAVAAAGAVLLREQPLRDGHGAIARAQAADRPRSQGRQLRHCRPEAVDGMDVLAVEAGRARAPRTAVRAGGGPHFLECRPTGSAPTRCTTRSLSRQGRDRRVEAARPYRRARPRGCVKPGMLADERPCGDRAATSPPKSTQPSPSPRRPAGSRSRI